MRRKAVSQRLGSVAEVRASLEAHRDRIGDKLEARQPSSSGGDPGTVFFSYRAHFDHMEAELVSVEQGLVTAEDEHVRQQVRIVQGRRRAEELFSELYQKQVALRRILAGLYGAERGFELAAIAGRTPANPRRLAEQVAQTVQLLRHHEGPMPPQRIGGVTVDFAVVAGELHSSLVALRNARIDLDRARKTADRTRALANRAIAEYDSVVPWVVRSLEGLFRLVGERELADRIRGAVRRVTRRQGEGGKEETVGASEIPATLEPDSPPFESADVTSQTGRSGMSAAAQAFVSRIRRVAGVWRGEDTVGPLTRAGPLPDPGLLQTAELAKAIARPVSDIYSFSLTSASS